MRIDGGDFEFYAGEGRPDTSREPGPEERDVRPAIERASALMAEWVEIAAVVPSLAHRVHLLAEAPGEVVTLARPQWALVVAISTGRTVGELIADRGLSEFEGCRAVKELVDAALAQVSEPNSELAPPAAEEVAADFHDPFDSADVVVTSSFYGDVTLGDDFGMEAPFAVDPVSEEPEPVAISHLSLVPSQEDEEGAEAGLSAEDHYSALRAAVVEIGDDLEVPGVAAWTEPTAEAATEDESHVSGFEVLEDEGSEVSSFSVTEYADEDASDLVGETGHIEPDGRVALHALLAEVTAQPFAAPSQEDEPVDGLADRGPWTPHELAHFEGWPDEEHTAAEDSQVAAAHDPVAHEGGAEDQGEESEAEPEESGPEPINRGLLLKFLSSVRN
jgi:hypothetical protein